MPVMSAALGRLGSRYSLILDPIRKQVRYGALGLHCQQTGELVVGIDDGRGRFDALPLSSQGTAFHMVDQRMTQTAVIFDAYSLAIGAKLTVELVSPFWPQDEHSSTVPAYIVNFRIEKLPVVRWTAADKTAASKGTLRFGLTLPGAKISHCEGGLGIDYGVEIGPRNYGPDARTIRDADRTVQTFGTASDLVVPLEGDWTVRDNMLEVPFDVSAEGSCQEFSLAMIGYCPDALFERFGQAMQLKYTRYWSSAADVAQFVRAGRVNLLGKARAFDALYLSSSLPAAMQDLTASSFQTYLMNTMWAHREGKHEWFSVWEGACWFNSTVDVTYNEAMFYFACWPQLLEMIFEEWSFHANDAAAETHSHQQRVLKGTTVAAEGFAGRILEHDMGGGWTANGQTYGHAMPVEENSNFLLLLYAHGKWWGREKLFRKYKGLCQDLVTYLFWTDSTGNGFPDRGTANTIDDATPAVQYGRDNVYLGIKRLAALHAAGRMFEYCGDELAAGRCKAEVRKAVRTLNANWLDDHWGVCLDKSAEGLVNCWTGAPLPFKVLPGWDAYSLYTTNGLLPLMMVDDLPPGISPERLRLDCVNACRESMTLYGCGHSSMDKKNMWVSMNAWRDCAAGYLGEDMSANCERYWNQQLFANGPGSEKPNCFTETSLTNNLTVYPRGAAVFGLPMAMMRLTVERGTGKAAIDPIAPGRYPLLALANWKTGKVPHVVVERKRSGRLAVTIQGSTGKVKVS